MLVSCKAVDVTSKSFCVISKIHYSDFMVFCLYTFNLFPLSLKRVTTLVATTYKNMESRLICKTTYVMRVKESEMKQFAFIFRLNTVLHNSYQADEIVMEIVPDNFIKSSSRFLLSVLKTLILS